MAARFTSASIDNGASGTGRRFALCRTHPVCLQLDAWHILKNAGHKRRFLQSGGRNGRDDVTAPPVLWIGARYGLCNQRPSKGAHGNRIWTIRLHRGQYSSLVYYVDGYMLQSAVGALRKCTAPLANTSKQVSQ